MGRGHNQLRIRPRPALERTVAPMPAPRFILALEDGRSFFGFRALDPGQSPHDQAATGTGGE
ncbi:MAG TPA: hypothetical protein DCP73_11985, partial [Chloroflexi bacterium]|nr:hypothetical protein [Chloroflexota bacterium]